ncbi:von Willebrand domain protein [Talaromyces stipitatus ATCC 10500]|uniref:von Willebrand domain protein n=1 Tax=Talaromyces stipitatus (strain ATCC 10500 / CBS 375.48 / QM 6759 / NRRL 1006) TaxID=441959 RepID=B8M4G2_TALSN|nr:von Willebrand domain protein [Talaromyces stipitatus ATCC 10500]EED19157.1 von Willebrand domain protein [Talaromyces stipitatus ATCC 10500]
MDALGRLQSGLFVRRTILDSAPYNEHYKSLFRGLARRPQVPASWCGNSTSPDMPTASPSGDSPAGHEVSLPLLSVSIDVDIHGRYCTTKVVQKFSAVPSVSHNVKYVFPVYDGSVVTSFRCWIGNEKLLEGAVKAKEEARADFKHAVSQRKIAVLVEELVPEVFETSVGNIPAQTTVKVEITYANLLKVDNSTGGLVLTIPTSIAPRYGNPPSEYSENRSLLTGGLQINVQASMPAVIRKMESRSHPISVELGAVSHKSFRDFVVDASSDVTDYSKARATLSDRHAILDQDFVLHILSSSRESLQSRAIAAMQPGQNSLSTIALTLHPGDLFRQNVNVGDFAGEIIFMADRSGSMMSKIPSLINVMNIFLRSLPEKCSFNISSFGSRPTWLWPSSKRYSQEDMDIASQHVNKFQANYGGTEIYGALESVLDHYNKQNDVPTSVILLTDGEVWDVDNVIKLVRKAVSESDTNIRFFSLGIGGQVSHRLVEGIGEQGGGYAEIVPESLMNSWQERVIQMLKAALTPSRLQCTVELEEHPVIKTYERQIAGYKVQYPECVRAPHHIPILNAFSHFSLYYMLESDLKSLPNTINITATTDKGEKLTVQLPILMIANKTTIHYLAAKAFMNDFETGQSWLHSLNQDFKSTDPTGFEMVLEQEAQRVGKMWSIPSKWTSYVAIDRTTSQHQRISVYKADAIKVPQLMRAHNPRDALDPTRIAWDTPFTLFDANSTNDTSFESNRKGALCSITAKASGMRRMRKSNSSFKSELTLTSEQATDVSSLLQPGPVGDRAIAHARMSSDSIPSTASRNTALDATDTNALEGILRLQKADGRFKLAGSNFRELLKQKYVGNALKNFINSTFHQESSAMRYRISELSDTILTVVYITHTHAASKALWELQITKAREWIKRTITEWLKNDTSEVVPGISLQELEESIIEELKKQDPFLGQSHTSSE